MPSFSILLSNQLYQLERARSWPSEYSDDAYNYAHSTALICPRCLQQWCVMAFEGDEELHPQGAYCEQHGDGRLLLKFGALDLPLLAALPPDLLLRELILTLKLMETEP